MTQSPCFFETLHILFQVFFFCLFQNLRQENCLQISFHCNLLSEILFNFSYQILRTGYCCCFPFYQWGNQLRKWKEPTEGHTCSQAGIWRLFYSPEPSFTHLPSQPICTPSFYSSCFLPRRPDCCCFFKYKFDRGKSKARFPTFKELTLRLGK